MSSLAFLKCPCTWRKVTFRALARHQSKLQRFKFDRRVNLSFHLQVEILLPGAWGTHVPLVQWPKPSDRNLQLVPKRKGFYWFTLRPKHSNEFSCENAYFLVRFRPSSTLKQPKTLMKTEAFENGFKSGAFWQRSVSSLDASKEGGFWLKTMPRRRHILSFPSTFSGVLVWTIGENISK